MRVVIFRHAERHSYGNPEPLLNAEGIRQSQDLLNQVLQQKLPKPDQLWVSKKIRTQQTLQKVADHFNLPFQVVPELGPMTNQESGEQFRERVRKVLAKVEKSAGTAYICSHLDWVDESISLIPSDAELEKLFNHHWPAGDHLEFEVEDGLWHFKKKGSLNYAD